MAETEEEMMELRGKNAILTGASRGIGAYLAKVLAGEGINLALAARSADLLNETRRACESVGVRAIALAGDISSLDENRRLVAAAEQELGQIDILVNNAGIEYMEEFRYLSIEQIDQLLTTNLNAPMRLTKLVLPSMLERRSGSIVNIASLAGKSPTPYATAYSASKHGLVGFTLSLEGELEGTGVTAGVVCPGYVADAGMYADHEKEGALKAGRLTAPVSLKKVGECTIRAIKSGGQHVAASSSTMRPLLAMGEMLPSMKNTVVKRLGVVEGMRREANRARLGHDRPGATQAADQETADAAG